MQKSARKSYISGKTRFEVGGQSVRYLASRDVLTKKSGAAAKIFHGRSAVPTGNSICFHPWIRKIFRGRV